MTEVNLLLGCKIPFSKVSEEFCSESPDKIGRMITPYDIVVIETSAYIGQKTGYYPDVDTKKIVQRMLTKFLDQYGLYDDKDFNVWDLENGNIRKGD